MIRYLLLFFLIGGLVGCGSRPTAVDQGIETVVSTAEPTAVVAAVGTAQPTANEAPAPADTPMVESPLATELPTPTEAVVQPTETMLAQATESAGIPAGLTSDNIFYLGNPDAPVTVTDFSDFL